MNLTVTEKLAVGVAIILCLVLVFLPRTKEIKFDDRCETLCKSINSNVAYCSEERKVVICQ